MRNQTQNRKPDLKLVLHIIYKKLFKEALYKFKLFQTFLSISSISEWLLLEVQFVITYFLYLLWLPTLCLFLKNKNIIPVTTINTVKNKCGHPPIDTHEHAQDTYNTTHTLIHKCTDSPTRYNLFSYDQLVIILHMPYYFSQFQRKLVECFL